MATELDHLTEIIKQWGTDGFLPFEPKLEKRPFGYHRTLSKDDNPIVPCPNCDAPNERSNFLRPNWQMKSKAQYADPAVEKYLAWLKTPDGRKLIEQVGNARAHEVDGVHTMHHPSLYETSNCQMCRCQVFIPGGYLNTILAKRKKDRPSWYYKPCIIPPKHEYDIEGQLDSFVWFAYWGEENGQVIKETKPSDIRLRDMYQSLFTINAHTGGICFFQGHVINNWGSVRLIDHWRDNHIGTGLWCEHPNGLREGLYNPIYRKWYVFIVEHAYIGNSLPADLQVARLVAGLSKELLGYLDRLEPLVRQYIQEELGINPDTALKEARFKREHLRLAACRKEAARLKKKKKKKTEPGQISMF